MREWHILKGNKRSETAHNLIFFDTETHAERLPDGSERDYLWFGWLCVVQRTSKGNWGPPRYYRFSRVSQFWRTISQIVRGKSRWFIFCHNTSYDLPVIDIFGSAERGGWRIKSAVIEAPPTIISLERDGVTLTFLDTLNWWRTSLEKIGEQQGIPKLEMPAKKASREVWDTYCCRDVDVMRVAITWWLAFLQDNDLGGFSPTLAGQAFRTFRHRFMAHEIVIDGDERATALSREAYTGGRVECFQLGKQKGPITGLDINSMYLSVMKGNRYPIRLLSVYDTQSPRRWHKLVKMYCLVARCTVNAAMPCYPLKTKNGLCFPLGRFQTTLCTPEIALALERGELETMTDIAVYDSAEIFTDFVDYFKLKRDEATLAGDLVAIEQFKVLGNSCYGKFGQTGLVYESSDWIKDTSCKKYEIFDHQTRKWIRCRQLGGLLQTMSSEGESRDSFPAISAHVTSYGRVLLWRGIEAAGINNVLYCDTDSLYVRKPGLRGVRGQIDPMRLGAFKRLGTYAYMTLHGLKDYVLPGKVVRKGVRKNAKKLGPNKFQQTQWSSLKGLVMLGDVTAPRRKQVVKVLKRQYKKTRNAP